MGMQIKQEADFAGGVRLDGMFVDHVSVLQEDESSLLAQALQRLEQQNKVLAFFEEKWLSAQHDLELLMDSQMCTKERLARLTERARNLHRTAIHDELTGLSNRRLLMNRLSHAIVQAERSNRKIGIVFIDLREFKRVNEQYGRSIGDQSLQQLSQRIEGCVRGGDTVGRYGSDEFVILLPELQRPRNIETVVDKLRAKLLAPFLVEDRVIKLSADFGVATYPTDARHPQALLKRAHAALHESRRSDVERRSVLTDVQEQAADLAHA